MFAIIKGDLGDYVYEMNGFEWEWTFANKDAPPPLLFIDVNDAQQNINDFKEYCTKHKMPVKQMFVHPYLLINIDGNT